MPSIVIEDLEIKEELLPAEMEAVFGGKKKKKKKKKDKDSFDYAEGDEDPFMTAMKRGETQGIGNFFFW